MKTLLTASLLALFVVFPSLAEVTLPSVLSDHMVLQRDQPVPVWGMASPGETVTVTFGDQSKSTVADDQGQWRIDLDAMPASAEPRELVVAGETTVTLMDVLVGEVWVASGQSNMAWPMNQTEGAEAAIAASDDAQLRLFSGKHTVAQMPEWDNQGAWQAASPQTVPAYSAVALYFGKRLREALGVPVGVVHISWGGTPAEAWTSWETLGSSPEFAPILERFEASKEGNDERVEKWREALAAWRAAPEDQREGRAPRRPYGPGDPHQPAGLYNGMVMPVVPYAARGVIWYQGESNVNRAEQYRTLFPAMIADWRNAWTAPDLPFLFVQLANYRKPVDEPGDSQWAELQDAQRDTLETVPHTGIAVINDIGAADDIHPRNKKDVGERLARWALVDVYDQDGIIKSGPLFKSARFEDGKAIVTFETFGGELQPRDGQALNGFTLGGDDKVFHKAQVVEHDGDTLVVVSDAVPNPVAVRYAWADNPVDANVVGGDGLPASVFRSDDWPGATAGKR